MDDPVHKKHLERPQEEWQIFKDTHPAIIDEETFLLVQELSSYHRNSDVCSAHYIREKVMAEIVLESMQRVFWCVQSFEKDFARKQMATFGDEKKKELAQKQKELSKAKNAQLRLTALSRKSMRIMSMGRFLMNGSPPCRWRLRKNSGR